MALTTSVKQLINAVLRPANLKIETLTAERQELARLTDHVHTFGFEQQLYALSPGFAEFDVTSMADAYARHRETIERLKDPARNDTGYKPGNSYYDPGGDLEALYLIVRRFAPRTVVEVGCGNSTKITRQAIIDGRLDTRIVAIDPHPRADIAHLVDEFAQNRVEAQDSSLFSCLEVNDILFIDSTHELRAGNDVAHLFCRIIPLLKPGVIVHVHDIFLPYEYPPGIFFDYASWGEQYLLHALLAAGGYEILWPGHYLQRARPETHALLPFLAHGSAQSFWMRKK
jgi:hypothetical protein